MIQKSNWRVLSIDCAVDRNHPFHTAFPKETSEVRPKDPTFGADLQCVLLGRLAREILEQGN